MSDPVNPAAVNSLSGTMPSEEDIKALVGYGTGQGLTSEQANQQAEAYRVLMQAAQPQISTAAAQASAAGQALASAQGEYTAAQQAPARGVSPLEQALRYSIAGASQALTQQGTGIEGERRKVESEELTLAEARKQNITRLRDIYNQRAEAASKANNTQQEVENRLRSEAMTKTLGQINQYAAELRRNEQEASVRAQQRQERQTEKLAEKPKTLEEAGFGPTDLRYHTTLSGKKIKFIPVGELTATERKDIRPLASQEKVLMLSNNDVQGLSKIDDTKQNLTRMTEMASNFPSLFKDGIPGYARMTARSLQTWAASRGVAPTTEEGKKLTNFVAELSAMRSTAIQMVQTLASLGTGLRINQAEINAVLTFDYPTADTPLPMAMTKLNTLRTLIGNLENSLMSGRGGVGPEESFEAADANVGRYNITRNEMLVKVKDPAKVPTSDGKPPLKGQLMWINPNDPDFAAALSNGGIDASVRR